MIKNLDKILEHVEKGLLAFSQGFVELASAASAARIHIDDEPKHGAAPQLKRADHTGPVVVKTVRVPTFEKSVFIPRNGFPREGEKTSFDYKTTIDFLNMVDKTYQITGNSRGKRSVSVSANRFEKCKVIATREIKGSDPRKEIAAVLTTGPNFGTILHFNRHELTLSEANPCEKAIIRH